MIKQSRQHLEKSQEKYFSHCTWAILSGLRLILAGLGSIIHGLVPGLFQGIAAKTVIYLYHKRLINHPNREYQDYINSLNANKN